MVKFDFKVGGIYKTSQGYDLTYLGQTIGGGLSLFYVALDKKVVSFYADGQPFASAYKYGKIVTDSSIEQIKQEPKAPTKSLGFITLDGVQYPRRGIQHPELIYRRYCDTEYYYVDVYGYKLRIGEEKSSFSNDKEYFAGTEPIPDELCDQERSAPETKIKITPKFQMGELVWFKHDTTNIYFPCEITDFTITNEMRVVYEIWVAFCDLLTVEESCLYKVRPQ